MTTMMSPDPHHSAQPNPESSSSASPEPAGSSTSSNANLAVSIQGLTKTYRSGFWLNKLTTPLKDCTLNVAEGETFGLLGPNGAGKTTTIKCLLGIIQPSAGSGTLLGKPLGDRRIKQRVGYLPENPYFYDYLTAWEFLTFAGQIFQLPQSVLAERIPALFQLVGLSVDVARKRQLRTYSKGMLQRTGMAQALINDPELVFLDEPMSGLDPLGRYQMREIILSLKQQGKTVFFNSHILGDVETICDRIGILVQGRLVCQGSLDELLGQGQNYQVRGRGGDRQALNPHFHTFESSGNYWQAQWNGSPNECLDLITQHGGEILDLSLQRQSLEAFFLEQVRAQSKPSDPSPEAASAKAA